LQEFDVEIRDKKRSENVVADHLSRMNREGDKELIKDKMRDDHLYRVLEKDTWMINIIRAIRKMPLDHLDKNEKGDG
jgi:predicted transcriptional regulator